MFTGYCILFLAPAMVRAQARPTTEPANSSKPEIRALTPMHDFGPATAGMTLRHAFKITNAGTGPLAIDRVAPSCGCMTAGSYPSVLAAGQTGDFPFTLDTASLFGPYMKTINIFSNDPVTPTLTLTLRGESKRLIEVSPTTAGFGRIADEQTREQVLTITNRSDQPMAASIGNRTKAGKFEFELAESVPGFEYKLFVVLRPPRGDGTLSGSVTLNTNIESQKTFDVTAMAIILPRIEALPGVLYFAEASPTNPISSRPAIKPVEFFNHGAKPVYLVEATVDDPLLKLTTKEVEPGRLYRVLVSVPAGYKPPAEGRTVTLKTDDADRPTFQLPIRLSGAVVNRTAAATTTRPTTTASAEAPKKPVMDLVGKPAPSFSLRSNAGTPVGSADFKGYPATVLNFVAPNCPFCKKQIPTIEPVRMEYEARGVRFVNIGESLHEKVFSAQEAQAAFDKFGSHLELAMDELGNKVGNLFKVKSFPILVLVGKDGLVVDAFSGSRADLPDKLRKRLDELLRADATGIPAKAPTGEKP